jgi:integrase
MAVRGVDGKRHYLSARVSDEREATILANVFELEAEVAKITPATEGDIQYLENLMKSLFDHLRRDKRYNPTIRVFIAESLRKWYGDNKVPDGCQANVDCLLELLDKWADEHFRDLTEARVEHIARALEQKYLYGTADKRFRFLRRVLKRAKAKELFSIDPVADVKIRRKFCKQPAKRKCHGLDDHELEKIYRYIAARIEEVRQGLVVGNYISAEKLCEIRGLLIAGENFGPRLKECCSLRLSNFEFKQNRVNFVAGKTGKENSYIMLPSMRIYADSVRSQVGQTEDAPLFKLLHVDQSGKTGSIESALYSIFKASGVRTKTRPVTFRFLRRRVADEVGQVDPFAARDLLNHSHLNTTEIYKKQHQASVDKGTAIMATKCVADKLHILDAIPLNAQLQLALGSKVA